MPNQQLGVLRKRGPFIEALVVWLVEVRSAQRERDIHLRLSDTLKAIFMFFFHSFVFLNECSSKTQRNARAGSLLCKPGFLVGQTDIVGAGESLP